MKAIEINNLTKKYNDVIAVDNLNLTINEGELYALLGVNGAGKTTTIKMLTGLIKPTDGDAFIYNNSIKNKMDLIKPLIDVSMQETAIARKLTVKENIEFYGKICGYSKEEIKQIKEKIYEMFSFKNIENKMTYKLSGGWQRKLSIALALISSPKVLFLDEPTLGLDVLARRELWKVIESLKGKITIILTTHYMEEAESLADKIGIMKDGKLLFNGFKDELYRKTYKDNVEDSFIAIVSEEKL